MRQVSPAEPPYRDPQRILMMIVGDIADTLRMTPYIKAIRRRYPSAHLAVLVSERGAAVLARSPYPDEVIIRRISQGGMPGPGALVSKLAYLFALAFRLRGRFDVVLGSQDAGPLWNALAFFTGAQRRIGFDLHRTGFLMTTNLGKPDHDMLAEQRTDRLLREMDVSGILDDPLIDIWPGEHDDQEAASLLRANGIEDREEILALCPGSDWSCQQWQLTNWAAVADALARRHRLRVVVLGTADEGFLAERLARQMRQTPVDLTGKTTSLGLLAAVIRRCRLAITLESAPSAVALAVGTPLVALFGSHDVWVTGQHRAPAVGLRRCAGMVPNEFTNCKIQKMSHSFHRCQQDECVGGDGLNPITPHDVLKTAEEVLASSSGRDGESTLLERERCNG